MLKENLQSLKKMVLTSFRKEGLFNLELVGKTYKVCYEASHYREERDYQAIKFLAKDKKCILDVGANVGTSTLLLAENNDATIYAFEASEFASSLVIKNVSANGIAHRVKVVNTLISNRSGSVIPFYWDFSSGGASIYQGRLGHNFVINKSSICLDDYVDAERLKPDLIKVDVEGAEMMVLQGAEKIMRTHKPLFFLELHSIGDMPLWENAKQINEVLKELHYKMIYLRTKNEINQPELLKDRGRCHVLLMSSDRNETEILNLLDTSAL